MKKKTWLVRTLSLCLALFMAVGMVWTGQDLGVRAETQYNEVAVHQRNHNRFSMRPLNRSSSKQALFSFFQSVTHH